MDVVHVAHTAKDALSVLVPRLQQRLRQEDHRPGERLLLQVTPSSSSSVTSFRCAHNRLRQRLPKEAPVLRADTPQHPTHLFGAARLPKEEHRVRGVPRPVELLLKLPPDDGGEGGVSVAGEEGLQVGGQFGGGGEVPEEDGHQLQATCFGGGRGVLRHLAGDLDEDLVPERHQGDADVDQADEEVLVGGVGDRGGVILMSRG